MATITQTIEEFLPTTITKRFTTPKAKMNLPPKTKLELPPQTLGCPPDCSCKKTVTTSYKPVQIFFTAMGILLALIATYLIVTTNSNMYLIFWICYSVLRRLSKPRAQVKKD